MAHTPKLSDLIHPASAVPSLRDIKLGSDRGRSRGGEDRESSVSMTNLTVEHKANRPLEEYVFPRTLGPEEDEDREVRMTA